MKQYEAVRDHGILSPMPIERHSNSSRCQDRSAHDQKKL